MPTSHKIILQNEPRWKSADDPSSIVIPGLDTDASPIDQIEQIEQLITIKLQNIDENFSKIHNILANKLLPAVKRYAVGTEPVREAGKFWTSFYEQAAQIRIPNFDDHSTVNEMPSELCEEIVSEQKLKQVADPPSNVVYETTALDSESSFLPGQAAFSSTPATARQGNVQDSFVTPSQDSDDPSWANSIESPLRRLNRELINFSADADQNVPASSSTQVWSVQNQTSYGRAERKRTSAEWRGVVNLRDRSVLTPQQTRRVASKKPITPLAVDDDNDSFYGLPPGMSPPVMMSPARPPRSSAELGLLKLGQTPTKEASARIKRDLLRDAQFRYGKQTSHLYNLGSGDSESSMSTLPTPPSLSRYTRHFDYSTSRSITKDSSLESVIRHIRSDMQPTPGLSTTPALATTPALRLRPRTQAPSAVEPSLYREGSEPVWPAHVYEKTRQDDDSDSDSLDEINNTAHPSAAFLMASQGGHPDDDSFGSSNQSNDSLTDEDGLIPIHPFANVIEDDGFEDDDSFDGFVPAGDDFQEQTVFSATPGERERIHALRMMGQDLLEDTIGKGAAQLAVGAEDSPTPASWAR